MSERSQLTEKELQAYEDFDTQLVGKESDYLHTFANCFGGSRKYEKPIEGRAGSGLGLSVAAKVLYEAEPECSIKLAYEILKLHRQDITPKEVNKKWEESPTHIPEHAHFVKRKESARQEKRP